MEELRDSESKGNRPNSTFETHNTRFYVSTLSV